MSNIKDLPLQTIFIVAITLAVIIWATFENKQKEKERDIESRVTEIIGLEVTE